MSVFPFPNIVANESSVALVSNTAVNASPHTGKVQTVDRQGERLRLTMTFRNLKDDDRARLMAFVASMNGQQNRFTVYDHSYTPRGVLSATEMLDVAFNATNWAPQDADRGVLTDTDTGVRFKTGSDQTATLLSPGTADGISAATGGLSYAATLDLTRFQTGKSGAAAPPVALNLLDATAGARLHFAFPGVTDPQRIVRGGTAPSASTVFVRPQANQSSSGGFASIADMQGLSVARAFLVDNGFNALTYSQEFDNAAWTKNNTTVSADATAAPDGSTTADELIEDSTASAAHNCLQAYTRPSVVEYWTATVYIEANTSRRIRLQVDDGSGNGGNQFFDATSGTQTATATNAGTGTNTYASMHDIGGGRYRCRVTARLPATTSARIVVSLCDGANNTIVFNGDGSSGLYVWGAQIQRGGQLGRYTPTTTAAVTGTDQTGKRVWLKGLDADTAGQRRQGDQIEIDGHLAILTADLDGDESGVGLAEITPRIPTAPSDEAPVVLYRPHGKWMLTKAENGWSNRPGVFSDLTIEAIQDI